MQVKSGNISKLFRKVPDSTLYKCLVGRQVDRQTDRGRSCLMSSSRYKRHIILRTTKKKKLSLGPISCFTSKVDSSLYRPRAQHRISIN